MELFKYKSFSTYVSANEWVRNCEVKNNLHIARFFTCLADCIQEHIKKKKNQNTLILRWPILPHTCLHISALVAGSNDGAKKI